MSGWLYHPWQADEAATPTFDGPGVTLNQSRLVTDPRRRTIFALGGPVVVGAGLVNRPAEVYYQTSVETNIRGRVRREPFSVLRPPAVVAQPAAAFVATPIKIKLAARAYDVRRATRTRLGPPRVVGPAVVFYGPRVRTVVNKPKPTTTSRLRAPQIQALVFAPIAGYLTPPRSRNPAVHYALRGPTATGTPVSTDVFGGPRVKLVPLRRPTPPTAHRIAPPTVLAAAAIYYGPSVHLVRARRPIAKSRLLPVPSAFQPVGKVAVHLAYSRRGRPKSILRKPVVIDLSPQVYYLSVWLTRNKPKPTTHLLRPPTDLVDQQDVGRLAVHLTYSRRGKAKPRLWPVPAAFQPVGFVRVHLAYSLRGKPKSKLRPPTVIDLRPQVYSITTWLTYSRRGVARYSLKPPTTVAAVEAFYGPQVTLVRRPTPKAVWRLGAPQNIQALVFAPIQGYLTPPRSTRPKTAWALRPPTTVVVTDVFYGPAVSLAYSRRGKPKSILRAPIIPPLARPIDTTLVRIRPVATRYGLRAPTVIDLRPQVYSVQVNLTYSRRGKATYDLGGPVVIFAADEFFLQGPGVSLAYQSRGRPKSKLRPPTAVFPFFARPTSLTLAYQSRGRPKSFLRPPTDTIGLEDRGRVDVTLAASHRLSRKTDYRLGPPVVIDLRPQTVYLSTWLAYSRRGAPHSFLRPESKFAPTPKAEYDLRVTLAYQSRGKPKSRLKRPTVIDLRPQVYYLSLTLAPIPRRKTRSFLRPPVVVARFIARPTEVTLAPQARRPGAAVLAPPAAVRYPAVETDVRVSLAYSPRGRPKSRLQPPAVVYQPPAVSTLAIRLTYSRRGRPIWKLRPPTVVTPFFARAIEVTLVRIRPVPTRILHITSAPGAPHPCYGVSYPTIRPSAENLLETTPGAETTSSITAPAAAGSVAPASTIEGDVAPGAENIIGDEQREGC